ncbi:hypothetical protein FJ250_12275 [bacterium]|nr:hypothetical protein [bacterium]
MPPRPGKLWLDTWQANAGQLIDAGVPSAQVWISGLCSRCFPSLFHSYRADGAAAGRMLAGIRARGR